MNTIITRAWHKFAPQIVAFLAAGVPATAVIAILGTVGIHIPITLAALLAGGLASIAAYIQKDNLLGLDAKALTGKLAAFVLSGLTATTVVGILSALHVALPDWAAAALPIVVGLIAGYFKNDTVVPQAIITSADGSQSTSTLQ